MKANRKMKRLYVGGLSQTISQTDLKNQFSRFGEVSDVEIITRKDDEGNPQKIFAYINITVTEADLKKCMSVLNKTKWKGGTLQIQEAKESFLHRLAQEREEAKAKKENSRTGKTDMVKHLGAVDLHMKAVPGTEVPGHKNWVVSKYGRVLPVLHLKNQHKRKIIKYDPSKYCHNLKKIEENSTNTIPIANLTWHLEGGDEPMSKKQREFTDFHNPPKKSIKKQYSDGVTGPLTVCPRHSLVMDSPYLLHQQAAQSTPCNSICLSKSPCVPKSDHQRCKDGPFQTCGLKSARNTNSMSDDDISSEEELRAMIAREESFQTTTQSSVKEPDNDNFVVVREDFKSDVQKLYFLTSSGIKNSVSCQVSKDNVVGNDCDYDSGDTDEIIAMKTTIGKVKNSTEFLNTKESVCLKDRKGFEFSDDSIKIQKKGKKVKLADSNGVKLLNCKFTSELGNSEDSDSATESAESEKDKEYRAMMKNSVRVSLTLADLEKLCCSDAETLKEITESDSQETTTCCQFDQASKIHKIPDNPRIGRQCVHPEEIVASLLKGKKICNKQKPKENKFQAFKGISSLYGKESRKISLKEGVVSNSINEDQNSLKPEDSSSFSMERRYLDSGDSSRELTPCQHTEKANSLNCSEPRNGQAIFETLDHKLVSPSHSEKGSKSTTSLLPLKGKKSLSCGIKIHKISFDKDGCLSTPQKEDGSEEETTDTHSLTSSKKSPKKSERDRLSNVFHKKTQETRSDFPHSISNSSDVPEDKHAQDNRKRLAALDARQKAKEIQKKLVHNALANLDDHSEVKPKHIIFGSDSESETKESSIQEQSYAGDEMVKESRCKPSGKLFESSDEESDSEDDSNRFKIKPQFEGKAGQKLMNLQSHFGTDDRFRMDSRFLESDSEEEQKEINEKETTEEEDFVAEKKKALDIMQRVLNISLSNSTSKRSTTAKKFKDIIHYDPARHDHSTFERKRDDKPKESKTKRKKNRTEGEKLPEVSKEMYYDIASDLKERLQTTKYTSEKEENISWNEDYKTEDVNDPISLKNEDEEPAGFTFSFFDSNAKDIKEDTYRTEIIKPGKIAWQRDSCFQDSSSEGEDTVEEVLQKNPNPGEVSLPEKETSRFFFFSKNDERLHVGSELFWRGAGNNINRNSWEARTNSLHMDCRKKHKDAKRKVKPK
ncbi:PREDICTED: nucleolar protein 8 [Chrysochloris asiatica]|uniref:Nucleolar protein 8 n=1 Tax=Chrysochloris asiatica TaxID=185453 RepID=A0A9B0X2H9_CHRAS|nr:PREDICTED: nucleolar protein 8 [Chrysochloris asiatica]